MDKNLDILAFGAHPDDIELGCGGTIIKEINSGKSVGLIDLTRGELGTRGTSELRDKESASAAGVMGVKIRENLGFKDGFFQNDEEHQLEVIKIIRKYKPKMSVALSWLAVIIKLPLSFGIFSFPSRRIFHPGTIIKRLFPHKLAIL